MTIGQLMKNLRDKGWIPRGYNEVIHTVYDKKHKIIGLYKEGKKFLELVYKKSLRDLCAKESQLWQFVCDNGMARKKRCGTNWEGENVCYNYQDYEYWLICSALKDESELEQFLLDNIKIDG